MREDTLQPPNVEALVERGLEQLRVEFPDQAMRIEALGRAHLTTLRAGATVEDFLPTLVYRFTREDLRRSGPAAVARLGRREAGAA
jgi:hypothetical protein